ncbi:PREDICTED: programmed cell death protein 4-like [Priapulus caudatus]|uniref:Programmed cell death protein 4-like n=1 Tax=Priapulus caudatus TaxID=37621 RepID=A0ABM1F339_PRICU|nr:PREDICTED: programmed cell death protein 4-like [Priapulus caudatus]
MASDGNKQNFEVEEMIEDTAVDGGAEVGGGGDASGAAAADFVHPDRLRRKAKHTSKFLAKLEMGLAGTPVPENMPSVSQMSRAARHAHDRKSRMGKGRGLAKKGGAGGKGTWGKPGCELGSEAATNDSRDPNYDSGEDEGGKARRGVVVKELQPELTADETHREVEEVVKEYFEHGDTHDVVMSFDDLNFGKTRCEIVYKIISMAMDRKAMQRELASRVIADLYGIALSINDVVDAFDKLQNDLPDLTLDTPDAAVVLGNFMARCVADDCLPPRYVHAYAGHADNGAASQALERAEVLLSMKHGFVRLDNVWGVGGGIRPVKLLVKKMVLLLKEYLSSGDIIEATRCLLELEVPHFHHELVYEAIVTVVEDGGERSSTMMAALLKSLYDSVTITPVQMATGFHRVVDELPDLCLDVPNASAHVERFAAACASAGVITDALLRRNLDRGRKRFVSEGDGGRVKEFMPIANI